MENFIFTNISTYKAIADESYHKMCDLMEAGRKPLPDGGWVVSVDPEQKSFKQAMISVVFSAMWIDAYLHQLIAKRSGVEKAEELDRKKYEKKLQYLGVNDQSIISQVTDFREARNEMVHEKAYADTGDIKTAQGEAEKAYNLRRILEQYFNQNNS